MSEPTMTDRPCRFCVAAYGLDAQECEWSHEVPAGELEPLARKFAHVFGGRPGVTATDEHVGWYMEDAQAVIGDFDPVPERWTMRRLPDSGEFVVRFRLNDVTYVVQHGEGYVEPVRLSLLRQWEREADERAGR
jgi:hypothetical protein